MVLPGEFNSQGVKFVTSRTTPWERNIERWICRPHISIECYNLWANEIYLGVIYESPRDVGWCMLQLTKAHYYPIYEGEGWLDALESYLGNTGVQGLEVAN